jgi:hypothetical protein
MSFCILSADRTAKERILFQVNPKPLKFLYQAKLTDHIMETLLTFQHGNTQSLDISPSGLEISSIVSILEKLIGILTSTVPTFPLTLTWLATDPTCSPFLSSLLKTPPLERDTISNIVPFFLLLLLLPT